MSKTKRAHYMLVGGGPSIAAWQKILGIAEQKRYHWVKAEAREIKRAIMEGRNIGMNYGPPAASAASAAISPNNTQQQGSNTVPPPPASSQGHAHLRRGSASMENELRKSLRTAETAEESDVSRLKSNDVKTLPKIEDFPFPEGTETVHMDQILMSNLRNENNPSSLFTSGANTCLILAVHTLDKEGKITQIALAHISALGMRDGCVEEMMRRLVQSEPHGTHYVSSIGGGVGLAKAVSDQLARAASQHVGKIKLSFADANLDEKRMDNVAICGKDMNCYYENVSDDSDMSDALANLIDLTSDALVEQHLAQTKDLARTQFIMRS